MITRSSEEPHAVPLCPAAGTTLAAVDVEWSKNYRVKNGNVPFCFSVIWLTVPPSGMAPGLAGMNYHYSSVYVETAGETHDLIAAADAELARILNYADLITGHQLCSDLATLTRAAACPRRRQQSCVPPGTAGGLPRHAAARHRYPLRRRTPAVRHQPPPGRRVRRPPP